MTEKARPPRIARALERVAQDLRYGLRSLRRSPTFTVTSVLILALGIGMATAMFTVYRAVVLREMPVREPDRIVTLWAFRDDATIDFPLTVPRFEELRRATRTLQDVAGVVHAGAYTAPMLEGDRTHVLKHAMVTANYFDVLGARPVLGRLFRPEDGHEGAAPVTVLSYRAWQRHFGGDPGVVDRRLTLPYSQVSHSIVGVAPPGLDYPVGVDLWLLRRSSDLLTVVARLAPDATPAAARSEYVSILRRLYGGYPLSARIQTLTDAVLGEARLALVALTAAVALLLLIACVNVGNLLLLRSSLRVRELVIRRALGASPGQVARLLLVESVLLGVTGGTLGLVSAHALLSILVVLAPDRIPRMDMVDVAGTPVAIAAVVTLLAVLLFGVLPALAAVRGDLASALRLDSRSGTGTRRRRRVRHALVASQVALALVLLTGAGLLVRSLQRLQRLDLGYEPERLSIVELAVPFSTYDSESNRLALFEELYRRFRGVPGVMALTPVLYPPFLGANLWQVPPLVEGRSAPGGDPPAPVPLEVGGPEYFRTFGIPILRGRGFRETDREGSPRVVVMGETLAQRFWPGEDPIGKRIRFGVGEGTDWRTVVGVAGDIRFRRFREPTPTIYVPWRQLTAFGRFAVRTRGELGSVLPAMRRIVSDVDPDIHLWSARSMDDYIDEPLARPRLSALLLSGFGLAALLLAAIGLYGVMASVVRERTHDLGIRMALGATPRRLRRDVLGRALAVTALGAAVGLAAAFTGTRLLDALLFQVSPTDPATLVGVTVLLLGVAILAAYVPALRATRVDPVRALRTE